MSSSIAFSLGVRIDRQIGSWVRRFQWILTFSRTEETRESTPDSRDRFRDSPGVTEKETISRTDSPSLMGPHNHRDDR